MYDVEESQKAIIIDSYNDKRKYRPSSLSEVKDLCDVSGIEILDIKNIFIRNKDPKFYFSKGLLEEVTQYLHDKEYDLLIFNTVLSIRQIKQLQKIFRTTVFDRVRIILNVFEIRAGSYSSKLQIKLAKLRYENMGLADNSKKFAQQKAVGTTRGLGEKIIELERRDIKERIREIENSLKAVDNQYDVISKQRKKNSETSFALVGYTNAGKSSLMSKVSDEDLYIDARVFATLDAATRKITLDRGELATITDTIGFISDLPAFLIRAFKSTFAESVYADYILWAVDSSDDIVEIESRMKTVYDIITKMKVMVGNNTLIVFNKIDLIDDKKISKLKEMSKKYCSNSIFVSSFSESDMSALRAYMSEMIKSKYIEKEFVISSNEYYKIGLVAKEYKSIILSSEFDKERNTFNVRLSIPFIYEDIVSLKLK